MQLKNSMGKYYTRQLFWEESIEIAASEKSIDPVFTLYSDKPGLINFGKAYVESEDPSGYTVAQELFGDYKLWSMLLKCKWFQTAKKIWDEEMDARLHAKGMQKLKELLKDGPPAQQLAAARYLADKEYRKDKTASKGRPRKDEIDKAAREEADLQERLSDDYRRISIVK